MQYKSWEEECEHGRDVVTQCFPIFAAGKHANDMFGDLQCFSPFPFKLLVLPWKVLKITASGCVTHFKLENNFSSPSTTPPLPPSTHPTFALLCFWEHQLSQTYRYCLISLVTLTVYLGQTADILSKHFSFGSYGWLYLSQVGFVVWPSYE